jgi:thymidylate kinase
MQVICLEGNYGIGKTTIFDKMFKMPEFKDACFINEGFMELYNKHMDPNGIITEINWVSSWFKRLILLNDENTKLVIADRSPYSALFFTKSSKESLKCIIDDAISELKNYGIHVITLYLKTDKEVNWSRILDRLKNEPKRNVFNEDDVNKFDRVYESYDNFKWDITIENDDKVLQNLIEFIKFMK